MLQAEIGNYYKVYETEVKTPKVLDRLESELERNPGALAEFHGFYDVNQMEMVTRLKKVFGSTKAFFLAEYIGSTASAAGEVGEIFMEKLRLEQEPGSKKEREAGACEESAEEGAGGADGESAKERDWEAWEKFKAGSSIRSIEDSLAESYEKAEREGSKQWLPLMKAMVFHPDWVLLDSIDLNLIDPKYFAIKGVRRGETRSIKPAFSLIRRILATFLEGRDGKLRRKTYDCRDFANLHRPLKARPGNLVSIEDLSDARLASSGRKAVTRRCSKLNKRCPCARSFLQRTPSISWPCKKGRNLSGLRSRQGSPWPYPSRSRTRPRTPSACFGKRRGPSSSLVSALCLVWLFRFEVVLVRRTVQRTPFISCF